MTQLYLFLSRIVKTAAILVVLATMSCPQLQGFNRLLMEEQFVDVTLVISGASKPTSDYNNSGTVEGS